MIRTLHLSPSTGRAPRGRALRDRLLAFGCALACLLLAAPAGANLPYFNNMQKKLLDEGRVLVTTEKPTDDVGVAALAIGVVNAPVDQVWSVVRDCQHFSKFMPRAKKSELRSTNGNTMVCFLEVSMPFPLSNLWSEVTTELSTLPGGGHRRTWRLNKGNYKRNNGSWEAHPWGEGGTRTLLIYRLDVDPDMAIPDALLRKAQTGSIPDMFAAVRKRAGA